MQHRACTAIRWIALLGLSAGLLVPVTARAEGCLVEEYPGTEQASSSPMLHGLIEAMPDGNMWFGEANSIASIQVRPPHKVTKVPLLTRGGISNDVTAGADGGYWFTEIIANKIGRISARPPYEMVEISLPPGSTQPDSIVVGPDGALWFTEWWDKIGRISPRPPYVVQEFTVRGRGEPSGKGALVHKLVRGQGNTMWFTEVSGNNIGKVTVNRTGAPTITEVHVKTDNAGPAGLTVAAGGTIWFTELRAGQLGQLDPRSLRIKEFPLPSRSSMPLDITVGRGGDLFFTEMGSTALGRAHLSRNGTPTFSECGVPNTPYFLAAGPDGAIWFTEFHDPGIKIGRVVW